MERTCCKSSPYTRFYEFLVWFCFICLREAYFFEAPINQLFLMPPLLFSFYKYTFKVWSCPICQSEVALDKKVQIQGI